VENIRKVLLTGAGGFVGHHTLSHLLKTTKWKFVVTDSFRHSGTSSRIRAVFEELPESRARVKVVTHDLTVPVDQVTAHEFGNPDVIINMASESHVDRSITNPRTFVENNVALSLTVLEYARTLPSLKCFVQISTDEVFGPAKRGVKFGEWDAHLPSNPYAASKSAQEAIAISYWRTFNIPLIITNTMNIIGERQDVEKFVPLVIRTLQEGKRVPIHANKRGENWIAGSRFYLHARNQADALRFLISNLIDRPLKYSDGLDLPEKFNIVGEREITNNVMVELIAKYLGLKVSIANLIEYIDVEGARPGHDLRYALDGKKLFDMGWTPPVAIEDSLKRTVNWSVQNPSWLESGI